MAKVKLLDPADPRRNLDRYELIGEIATGGMATVFLARRGGVGGFQRFVAIKRLHPHLANEPEFVEMFLDEARLAALIHHPNVVPILEVGESDSGFYLVMEYVEGDTLARTMARTMSTGSLPPRHVVVRLVLDALAGLHAAHELCDDRGQLLGLVHRDCSPQNVLVGVDGTARITDFGVARASSRLTSTGNGKLKGKLAYMAPEQTRGDELDRRTDLFAMGIMLWETLCGRRLFKADSEAATLQRILVEPIRAPSEVNGLVPAPFDRVVLTALDRDPERRFQTAADFADALEAAARESARESASEVGVASPREVAAFVQSVLGHELGAQRESVRTWLAQSDSGRPPAVGFDGRKLTPGAMIRVTESHGEAGARAPSFEVAADITMRFSLDERRPGATPAPAPTASRSGAGSRAILPSGEGDRGPATLLGAGPLANEVVATQASTGEVDPTRGSGPPTGVEGDDAVTINLAPELLRTGEAPRPLVPDLSALVAAHRAKSERPPAAPPRDSSDGDSMPTPIAGAPPIPPPVSSSELAVFDRLEERGRVPRTLMSAGNEPSRAALGLPGATALPDVVLGPNDPTIVHPRRASSSTVAAVVVALLLTTLGVAMWWSSRTSDPSAPVAIEVRATTPASTTKPQDPLVLGTETSSTPSASAAAVSSATLPAQAVSAPPEPTVATPSAPPDRTAKPEAPKKPSPSRPTAPSKPATTPDPKPTPRPAPTPTGESLDNPYR